MTRSVGGCDQRNGREFTGPVPAFIDAEQDVTCLCFQCSARDLHRSLADPLRDLIQRQIIGPERILIDFDGDFITARANKIDLRDERVLQ